MKKLIIYFVSVLFLIGFVSAIADNSQFDDKGNENIQTIKTLQTNSPSEQKNNELSKGAQVMALNKGEFTLQNGKTLFVDDSGEKIRLRIGNYSVNCSEDCNLSQIREENKIQLQATLSNGRNAQIKIMPETASQTAIERLRLKSCTQEENCTIELKEVGKGNETKMAYEIKTKKESRFLGLFKSQATLETQIDVETGEVLKTKKPWWASIKEE